MGVWVIPTFGGITNTAAVNMRVQVFEWTYVFSFLGDIYLGVELLKWQFFLCCWIQFAGILLRIFAFIFISCIGMQFSFLVMLILVSAQYQPQEISWEVFPLLFLEEFGRNQYYFFFKGQNLQLKPSGPGLFFVSSFLITNPTSIIYYRSSQIFCFFLSQFWQPVITGNCPFHLRMYQSLSCVPLFVTPWTVTHQAPPSMNSPGNNT